MDATKLLILKRFCRLILLLLLTFPVAAQKSPDTEKFDQRRIQTFRLNSKLMTREMPYRVIFPPAYFLKKNKNARFPVVYLLHGLTGHFDNWTDKTKLVEFSREYDFIVVTPEGGDGWFTDSASVPNDRYESYIIDELIAHIDESFRTRGERNQRAVGGLSMGGYGALKFGLKYPQKFALVGSFSGALDSPLRGQNNSFLRPSIISVFGADENAEIRKANDIFRLARAVNAEKIKELPFIYFDCGTEDMFFQTNRDFAVLLVEKKIAHEFRQLPGAHNWAFWDRQAREFLRLSDAVFNPAKAKSD